MTELSTLGGNNSDAIDINEAGHVVGNAQVENVIEHACLWVNGKAIDLGFKNANGINNNDQIVGLDENLTAVKWVKNKTSRMGNGGRSEAIKINDLGQVVGTSGERSWNATLWSGAVSEDLSPIQGKNSIANSINNKGEIVGFSNLAEDKFRHATLWRKGVVTILNSSKDVESEAYDINNNSEVVGSERKVNADGMGIESDYAVLWRDGKAMRLGTGVAFSINDKRQAVGYSGQFASIYINGVATDLNTLIDPAEGWSLRIAKAINNSGSIVGSGYHNGHIRGYLLTPIINVK